MTVEWQRLRLAVTTAEGYVDDAKSVDDLIAEAVAGVADQHKPVVVWILDEEDVKTNDELEARVFCDEKIALAMKQYVCLKGEIQAIPDERKADKLAKKTPLFYFYDAAGQPVSELRGKRATSRSGFSSHVEKLWKLNIEFSLKSYCREMKKILDTMDRIEIERTRVTDKMNRAADNPTKLAKLQKELDALTADESKINEVEQELLAKLTLREEFRPENAMK